MRVRRYIVTLNGCVWKRVRSEKNGISAWESLANNPLFKNCSVKLFDANWKIIREKVPGK